MALDRVSEMILDRACHTHTLLCFTLPCSHSQSLAGTNPPILAHSYTHVLSCIRFCTIPYSLPVSLTHTFQLFDLVHYCTPILPPILTPSPAGTLAAPSHAHILTLLQTHIFYREKCQNQPLLIFMSRFV